MRRFGLSALKPKTAPGKPARSIWWRLHHWAGLQVSLFLAFVCLTGTLAVFSYELDWATRPAMWTAPVHAQDRASWGEVLEAAREAAPEGSAFNIYRPLHPLSTYDAVGRAGGENTHYYIHPGTAELTGTGGWFGFQRFLRNTHRHLMLPVPIGVSIVSLAAILLGVTLVTSFWVYKRWWRGFLRWPKGRTLRALIGDIHRLAGLWSLWFVALICLTGYWYLAEQWGLDAPSANTRPALIEATPVPAQTLPSPAHALDAGLKRLEQAQPGYQVSLVRWTPGQPDRLEVHGQNGRALLVRPRANAIWIDASTGALVGEADARALSAHQRIAEMADPLHFGTFGGYWTKTLWFLFGAILTGLSATGAMIYVLRIAKTEREEPGWISGLARLWNKMGRARWLAAALIVLPFGLAPFVL
ncbi:PepSY-associated TM helix domain-containing protein [Oceanicaulis sp. LC35]|uniref:PepSY-associated TM helix domain-containing protein n=1 Tax=Oceanicaulis sp. LC35 TaxID=3349635 RepID=UPI003F87CC99